MKLATVPENTAAAIAEQAIVLIDLIATNRDDRRAIAERIAELITERYVERGDKRHAR